MIERPATGPSRSSEVSGERNVAAANRTLALLNEQVDDARGELATLRRELAEVLPDVGRTRAAHLLKVNEQLVLAAIRAETLAETAISSLAQLARSSERDALTDTPNRALMLDRLENAIALARRRRTGVAVLFLDLDDFKQINDALGHAVGDEVLKLVSRRLESVVRDSDTISRHGGDEFLVLLSAVSDASDAALVAEKMLGALAAPSQVGGHALCLSASIGIAIYPEDGEDAATLISGADAAMFRSKRRKRGSFEFHKQQVSIEPGLQPATVDLRQQPPRPYESALAEQEPRLRDLRDANQRLVIAAMIAQELEAQTEESHRQQIKFLAIVAHELRNPLSPIKTATELLDRAHADEPLLARLQAMIRRQVAHMSRLVDDLLDGSRVSAGKFRLECSAVQLADILAWASESCQPALDAKHQHLRMQLPRTPVSLNADSVRLTQVFSNLLDNASKYTQEGGTIEVTVVVLDHAVTTTVSDNGIGIPAEILPDIFDLFVQHAHTREQHPGGLGIGLAVVRELVEAHGGTVVGKSAGMDRGSEFIVTLPMADAKA